VDQEPESELEEEDPHDDEEPQPELEEELEPPPKTPQLLSCR